MTNWLSITVTFVSLLSLVALAGCAVRPPLDAPLPEARRLLAGRIEEPDLAALDDGQLAAAWAIVDDEGHADIVLTTFDPRTHAWGEPCRVNPTPGSAVAGRQVGPRIAAGPGGRIVVAWVDRERDPAGDILLSLSEDHGRSFSTPTRVNDDPGRETGQEYHDVAVSPSGAIHVVWLDERDAPADYENRKQLYISVSEDGARSFSANRALTTSPRGVCPCCRPSLAVGDDGSVHVIYRDREADVLFVRTRSLRAGDEEFSPPVTLSGGWSFPGCPVNGPSIATGPGGRLWALWVEDSELRWGRSDDRGASFAATGTVEPQQIGFAGAAAHLALASSPEAGAFATWQDAAGQICFLALPSVGAGLGSLPRVVSGSGGLFAGSPAIESARGEVYVCWTEDTVGADADAEGTPRLAVLRRTSGGGGGGVLVPLDREAD